MTRTAHLTVVDRSRQACGIISARVSYMVYRHGPAFYMDQLKVDRAREARRVAHMARKELARSRTPIEIAKVIGRERARRRKRVLEMASAWERQPEASDEDMVAWSETSYEVRY